MTLKELKPSWIDFCYSLFDAPIAQEYKDYFSGVFDKFENTLEAGDFSAEFRNPDYCYKTVANFIFYDYYIESQYYRPYLKLLKESPNKLREFLSQIIIQKSEYANIRRFELPVEKFLAKNSEDFIALNFTALRCLFFTLTDFLNDNKDKLAEIAEEDYNEGFEESISRKNMWKYNNLLG